MFRAETLRYCYLVKKSVFRNPEINMFLSEDDEKNITNEKLDDAFSQNVRKFGNFALFLLTSHDFGQLVNLRKFPEQTKTSPELYRLFENHDLWERRYITQKVGRHGV
jgi:hypothetical protein